MSDFNQFLFIYEELINQIATQDNVDQKLILRVLNCRDQLHTLLEESQKVSVLNQEKLITLDQQLLKQSNQINKAVDFLGIHQSINKPEDYWWWHLDSKVKKHPWQKLDWLWKSLNIAGLAFNITLITDIASRFFVAGSTGIIGALTVALPSAITLLKASGDFNTQTNQSINNFLSKLKIKSYLYEELKLLWTVILTLVILALYLLLPKFSLLYNELGFQSHSQGNLGQAEKHYKRAVSLDPDNYFSHYNLGAVYEETKRIDLAKQQYLLAAKGNFPTAYNNLARFFILENKPSEAVSMLLSGLRVPDREDQTSYSLLKNFGWARFLQEDFDLAINYLQAAIDFYESQPTDVQLEFDNRASAYCLMAKTLEAKNPESPSEPELILSMWRSCNELGNINNIDEDRWLIEARKRLKG